LKRNLAFCFLTRIFDVILWNEGEKNMKELDRITVDPEICLGQPTIRGMRITVSVILKQIASGMTTQEILNSYPELEEEDIVQALKYAAWLTSEKAKPIPLKEVAGGRT
jgi:uncharacterized protein (DUF433 family)